jgi:hypothetical protein
MAFTADAAVDVAIARPPEQNQEKCPHCVPDAHETYRYFGRDFVFDVDRAREIVSDGREPVEVDDGSVRACPSDTRIHRQHLDHVDTKYPGIIAHISVVTHDGEYAKGHTLIDGNHRAAKCLESGRPFYAYVLDEDESEMILTRARPLATPVPSRGRKP